MKFTSLRARIAVSAAIFTAIVLAVFASFSLWWFYREQLDALSDDQGRQLTPEMAAEAWEDTTELTTAYLATLPVAAIFAALGAWWLGGRLSRPLVRLSNAAQRIDAHSLDARLPKGGGTDEIESLANTLNQLLERLESSFQQATRFSADASHELRTPLAIMRGNLEQLIEDEAHAQHAPRLVSLLEENQRLSSIVDKLLLLAKADAGCLMADFSELDLSAMLSEVVEDFSQLAEVRRITMEGRINRVLQVRGDPALLRRLAFNLFENALKYNAPEGWIRYSVERVAESAVFMITNSGPPIPTQVHEQIFERFFRIDTARGEGSAGLGLSLCREIARAHRGDLRLVVSGEPQTTFRLSIPCCN